MAQKMIPNTALTTRKVPSDSVMVVTRICFPAFFICGQISSVPIISPTTHSSRLSTVLNQAASSRASPSRPSAWGPIIIPAISQPRIAGSFSLDISLPATTATAMASSRRNSSANICIASISSRHL